MSSPEVTILVQGLEAVLVSSWLYSDLLTRLIFRLVYASADTATERHRAQQSTIAGHERAKAGYKVAPLLLSYKVAQRWLQVEVSST